MEAQVKSTVEILFVLGIILNLVKGADLILRPHQLKRLQDKWDSITLWLDYSKPIDWFFKKGKVRTLVLFLYTLILPWVVLYVFRRAGTMPDGKCWIALSVGFYYMVGLFNLGLLLSDSKPGSTGGDASTMMQIQYHLLKWLMENKDAKEQIFRLCVTASLGVIATLLVLAGIYISSGKRILSLILFLFFYGAMLSFSAVVAIGFVSLLTLLASLTIFFAELVLKLIRGIAWRIAEYNKGPLSAMVLILTILLGIAEAYIRIYRK